MIRIEGKNGISATILADSLNPIAQKRITSFELEYPRYIHAEVLTHRLFTRNAASSRAIPVKKKFKQIWSDPVIPIKFGLNKSGMQSSEEMTGIRAKATKFVWKFAAKVACIFAWTLMKLNLHKQWAGRLLEPFERYKIVLTSTEYANWDWLRDHEDAQPEIRELARVMLEARKQSNPIKLNPGEWHLPYIHTQRSLTGEIEYLVDGNKVDLETAKKVSAAACAQVSYRILNLSLEKARDIFKKLIESKPCHASPTEHQATPMWGRDGLAYAVSSRNYEKGITHIRIGMLEGCNLWSGNLCGWIQYRQLITDNVKW